MKKVINILLMALLIVGCQKEEVKPEEDKLDCKCGIVTEKTFNANTWKHVYKVRNQCTNNNKVVNLEHSLEEGEQYYVGDFVCSIWEW